MPSLARLFGPGSRGEAAISAEFARPGASPALLSGRIDRLAIHPDHVAIADFKTGVPQAVPPTDYIAQLALYRAAVQPLYPDRPVRAYLIWIDEPRAIEIDPVVLDAALRERLTPQ
jgi:ATP-dependent helicase/nuclease subunit A